MKRLYGVTFKNCLSTGKEFYEKPFENKILPESTRQSAEKLGLSSLT
jgi:hypothetical protein